MKLQEILDVMCGNNQLFCIENENGRCLYCGEVDKVSLSVIHGYEVLNFFPDRYGKFYNAMGITFVVRRVDE